MIGNILSKYFVGLLKNKFTQNMKKIKIKF